MALAWWQWEAGSEQVSSHRLSYRTSSSSSNLVAPAYHSVLLAAGAAASPFARTSVAMIIPRCNGSIGASAGSSRRVKSRAVDPEEDLRNGIGRGSSARGSGEGVRMRRLHT